MYVCIQASALLKHCDVVDRSSCVFVISKTALFFSEEENRIDFDKKTRKKVKEKSREMAWSDPNLLLSCKSIIFR